MCESSETHDDDTATNEDAELKARVEHVERRLRAVEGEKRCDCADCDLERRAAEGGPASAADALRAVRENVALRMQVCVQERRIRSLESQMGVVGVRLDANDIVVSIIAFLTAYALFDLGRRVTKLTLAAG